MAATKHQPPQHPLGPQERLAALQRRGLGCANRARALLALRHLDGQLFAEYCAALAKPDAPGHIFLSGTSFEHALQIHRFDGDLRVLLFAAIRTVELSLRAQWAYHPAVEHGPWFYANPALFKEDFAGHSGKVWLHKEALTLLHKAYLREAHETATEAPLSDFPADAEPFPPIWEVVGTMSFGQLARWYIYLQERPLREQIASTYGVTEAVLRSSLPSLVAVRNICAHHGRLYGRELRLSLKLAQRPVDLRESFAGGGGKPYNIMVFIAFMLRRIEAEEHREFVEGLRQLFDKCKRADPGHLGFPRQWWRKPVWRP